MYQKLGAALRVVVVSQVLPGDLYTSLAAQHVPQPIARYHHELILHYQRMLMDLWICRAHKPVSQQPQTTVMSTRNKILERGM